MVRRFGLVTEVDARTLEIGSTIELEPGGHVTPLARDTLRERRVTVVVAGSVDPHLPDDLAPVAPVRSIALGTDHTGLAMRDALLVRLRRTGRQVIDVGTPGPDRVDYPDVAGAVARLVSRREVDAGIVIDGSGLGSAIAANKLRGVRAAMCATPTLARQAREHAGTNVLTLGSSLLTVDEAAAVVDAWLDARLTDARYLRRLLKVRALEDGG